MCVVPQFINTQENIRRSQVPAENSNVRQNRPVAVRAKKNKMHVSTETWSKTEVNLDPFWNRSTDSSHTWGCAANLHETTETREKSSTCYKVNNKSESTQSHVVWAAGEFLFDFTFLTLLSNPWHLKLNIWIYYREILSLILWLVADRKSLPPVV